ncbi:glucokinase [Nitrosospira multiformis]|uniref:Glucokinase n=1 Tax=Nitrosospira multiformis TaxID=1231 RepID=A0A1H9Z6W0_9PROT|nr:glucokinase [Nitrosospira multiformis]SES77300.1 glucokinase [Nitrosospira multiformis]
MNEYFISGDIGGTKTLLQAAELKEGNVRVCCERRYESSAYSSFSDMLRDFINEISTLNVDGNPVSACFAAAGPIARQEVALTNLPWVMNSAVLSSEFSIPRVKLINDFAAVASGVSILPENDLMTLQAGQPYVGRMRVVLGAGTGMGGAWLVWQNGDYSSLPSEAGHIDFAPANELQDRLLHHLRKRLGHVSVERVLSGPGLTNVFRFLQDESGDNREWISMQLEEDDAARISDLAFNQKDPLAVKAMDLFVEIYGAYAGNLALAGLCRGGVYVAGGIAPKIIDKLREGGFMKAFRDKGRFSGLMEEIPVHVVMNPKVGLLGAAEEARRMLDEV